MYIHTSKARDIHNNQHTSKSREDNKRYIELLIKGALVISLTASISAIAASVFIYWKTPTICTLIENERIVILNKEIASSQKNKENEIEAKASIASKQSYLQTQFEKEIKKQDKIYKTIESSKKECVYRFNELTRDIENFNKELQTLEQNASEKHQNILEGYQKQYDISLIEIESAHQEFKDYIARTYPPKYL